MITKIKKKFLKVKGSNWNEKKFKNEKNKKWGQARGPDLGSLAHLSLKKKTKTCSWAWALLLFFLFIKGGCLLFFFEEIE